MFHDKLGANHGSRVYSGRVSKEQAGLSLEGTWRCSRLWAQRAKMIKAFGEKAFLLFLALVLSTLKALQMVRRGRETPPLPPPFCKQAVGQGGASFFFLLSLFFVSLCSEGSLESVQPGYVQWRFLLEQEGMMLTDHEIQLCRA